MQFESLTAQTLKALLDDVTVEYNFIGKLLCLDHLISPKELLLSKMANRFGVRYLIVVFKVQLKRLTTSHVAFTLSILQV